MHSLPKKGLIDRWINFAMFGSQDSIDQIGDWIFRPIAGLFHDFIDAQLHMRSLHPCSSPCNIIPRSNIEFCVSFAGPSTALLCFVVPTATGAARQVIEFTEILNGRLLS